MNLTRKLARAALVTAAYIAVTIFLGPLSYGPMQVRFAAGFYILAARWPEMVWGLALAAALANWFGSYGLPDVICGGVVTALTCYACVLAGPHRPVFALAAIPLVSAPLLAAYLHVLFRLPYLVTIGWIAIGQAVAATTVGWPLWRLIVRRAHADG